jgi:hypothetical protein
MLIAELKSLFAAAKVNKTIETAPPLEMAVLDTFYPESERIPVDSPVISVAEIMSVTRVVPVVARGADPVPVIADTLTAQYIEPLPVYVEDRLNPVDLNNLKLMDWGQKEAWSQRKVLQLRKTVKATMEALAAQAALNGKITHPLLKASGAYDSYTVSYGGEIHTVTVAAADKWDHADAGLMKVYQLLESIHSTLNRAGYPGKKINWAGKSAYATLLSLVDATDKPKVPVQVGAGEISLGGHVVKRMDEVYTDPQSGAEVAKVPDKELRVVSQGYNSLFFGALDDFKAGLKALPMFVNVIEEDKPSGITLTAMSKPLPVAAPKAVAKAVVLS